MSRLSVVGGDINAWGAILNDYLGQSLDTSGGVTATGSTTSRTLPVRFSETRNVKDFGAKGDGITDDTAAIVATEASLPVTGGIIFFPAGTYNFTDLVLTKSYVAWVGAGRTDDNIVQNQGTTILKYTGVAAAITLGGIGAVSNRLFQDFALQGNANATYGFRFRGDVLNLFLIRSDFIRLTVEGFVKSGAYGIGIEGGLSLVFTRTYVRSNDTNVLISGGTAGTTNIFFEDCISRTAVKQGFKLTGTPNTVAIHSTLIESNQDAGVLIDQPTNVLMNHILFRDTMFYSNNITTGTYQFQTNTHALGANIRQLLLDGVYFASPGAQNPGDMDLDGVEGASIRSVTGAAAAGKNILKIEATSADIHVQGIIGATGGAIDPDGRAQLFLPYNAYGGDFNIRGGPNAGSVLTLRGSNNAAPSNAYIVLNPTVGMGATVIGGTSPAAATTALHVIGGTASDQLRLYGTTTVSPGFVLGNATNGVLGQLFASNTGIMNFVTGVGGAQVSMLIGASGGIQAGSPTGGDKGLGTINASTSGGYYAGGSSGVSKTLTNPTSLTITNGIITGTT